MKKIRPTWFSAPLYIAALCVVGQLWMAYPVLNLNLRGLFCVLTAAVLAILLWTRLRLGEVEEAVRISKLVENQEKLLPVQEQLRHIVAETSDSTRRQVTTALADKQVEIAALQSQINPHFLYNTLDSIRGQALIDGSPIISGMAEALSSLFRYSISRKGNLVPLQEELRFIDKYMMIQQFRFAGKFDFRKEIDENYISCLIPRLTLQPIVENAIFYGLEPLAEGGIITIRLKCCGEYLVVCVSDNGVGIPEAKLLQVNKMLRIGNLTANPSASQKGSGIALGNINRRIRLTFGEQYGIVLSSTPGIGTDVEVILPLAYDTGNSPEEQL